MKFVEFMIIYVYKDYRKRLPKDKVLSHLIMNPLLICENNMMVVILGFGKVEDSFLVMKYSIVISHNALFLLQKFHKEEKN